MMAHTRNANCSGIGIIYILDLHSPIYTKIP